MGHATPDAPPPGARLFGWALAAGLAGVGVAVLLDGRGEGDPGEREWRLRIYIAVLSFWSAALWLALQRTRFALDRMEELLDDVRFGTGTKRDRDAVDILVRALRVDDRAVVEKALLNLKRITGQDLGEDPGRWEEWWRAARATFTRGGAVPPGRGGGAK
jgi:hypothetical protein